MTRESLLIVFAVVHVIGILVTAGIIWKAAKDPFETQWLLVVLFWPVVLLGSIPFYIGAKIGTYILNKYLKD